MKGKLTKDDIRGIIPPVVTPFFANEEIDVENFRRELRYMLTLRIGGLAIGGSTGEGHALTPEEAASLVEIAAKDAGSRVPIIAGIITTYTRDAIRRAKLAREGGADALMVTPPIHQPCSIQGLVEYYENIWHAAELPIILYNVVSRSPLTPAATVRLVEIPGVIATKESSGGTLETLDEILESVGDRISVTWAQDTLMLHGYVAGATGSITAINAVLPEHSVKEFEAIQTGDIETARRLHRQVTEVARTFTGSNKPAKIKACINLQGRPVGPARSPYVAITAEQHAQMRDSLERAGVLPAAVSS